MLLASITSDQSVASLQAAPVQLCSALQRAKFRSQSRSQEKLGQPSARQWTQPAGSAQARVQLAPNKTTCSKAQRAPAFQGHRLALPRAAASQGRAGSSFHRGPCLVVSSAQDTAGRARPSTWDMKALLFPPTSCVSQLTFHPTRPHTHTRHTCGREMYTQGTHTLSHTAQAACTVSVPL